MTDTYKCKACGYESTMPGMHCGQPMEKMEENMEATPAPAQPTTDSSATEQPQAPPSTEAAAENKPESETPQ